VILSGIHDFKDLQTGFPTKTASGMTFCKTMNPWQLGNNEKTYPKESRGTLSKHIFPAVLRPAGHFGLFAQDPE
jgi:hypothetical protein